MKRVKALLRLLLATCLVLAGTGIAAYASDTGGWELSKAQYSFLTKAQKKTYKKNVKKYISSAFTPVALLAESTEEGADTIYLCQGKTLGTKPKKPESYWCIVTVRNKTEKKVSAVTIRKLSISNPELNEEARSSDDDNEPVILPQKKDLNALPADARKVFKKALKKYVGLDLRPVALLGTQPVEGTNYRILCYGKGHGTSDLFILDLYNDLKNKATVESVDPFSLESYCP